MRIEALVPRALAPLLKPARYKGAYGGRGGGKSRFFAQQCILAVLGRGARVVCIREVQNSLRDSVRQLIVDEIQRLGIGQFFEVLEAEIRGRAGGIVIFRGMQSYNADNIKSLEGYDVAWVEEAQSLSQHSLDMLRPTIRAPGSELWFSWNPRYKTDPVDQFFRHSPPASAVVCRINWRDNPWFPAELRAEMLHDFATDPDKAEHVWEGGYGHAQGAILAKWVSRAERTGRVRPDVAYDPDGAPVEVSSDLGFHDTAAFWIWQRRIGGFALLAYDGDSGMDAEEWIPRLQSTIGRLGARLGKIWLPQDAKAKTFQSRHSTVEQFMAAFGPQVVDIVPPSTKADQVQAARNVIDRCEFHGGECEAGLDGLRAWQYRWLDDLQSFSREPLHDWASHPSDAFAYGCQVMQEAAAPAEPENRPIHGLSVGPENRATLEDLWRDVAPQRERF